MREVEFRRLLNNDNALRVRFELEHGQVLKFTIQLECRIDPNNKWEPVIRYDTAHGFAHCDRLHPYDAATKTEMQTSDYNEALNVAIGDLMNNWDWYRRRYEAWLKEK